MHESILVVEEESQNRKLFEAELAALGYDVESAGTWEDATRRFQASPKDLVLIDIQASDSSRLNSLEEFLRLKRDVKLIFKSDALPSCDFNYWVADAFLWRTDDPADFGTSLRGILGSI